MVVEKRTFILLVAVLIVGLSGQASAQETIFDPENPAFEEDPPAEEPRDDDRSEELIFDPENPAFDGDDDPDDSDDTRESQELRPQPPSFQNTQWGLNYEVGTLIDPRWSSEGYDNAEFVGGLGMRLRHDLSEETRLVISGRFRYWAGAGNRFDNWRTLYEPSLDRAYLLHRPGRWSFSVGQMRNSWGSTDIIRPGDVIDPVDMRDPTSSDGLGAGLAQLGATAGYSGRDWSLRALVIPFFQGNKVSLFGRDTALATERNPLVAEQLPFLLLAEDLLDPSVHQYSQSFLTATERPLDLPRNASVGLRGTLTAAGTDMGLGAFYGWDRTPWVTLDDDMRDLLVLIAEDGQVFEDFDFAGFIQRNPEAFAISQRLSDKAEAGETLFASEYRRRTTVLADFARYLGPIGVRGDIAFSPRRVFYTADFDPVWRSSVFSALGLSHERLIDGIRPLAMTLEGFWLHAFSQDSALHRALVPDGEGGQEDDELLLFDDGYYGLAAALNWHSPLWDTELQLGGMATISPGDLIGRVSLSRAFYPGLRLTVGANLFFGPDPEETLSLGGIWAKNDRLYVLMGGQF